jgi:FkbM family methyltransferase
MNEYYYLGNSTGMARLQGTECLICVDTRSWDSLAYIQGFPVEPEETSVMLRFISPGSVVLDIGANFGQYSLIASEIIGDKGKVYAFEANPHTYQYLRQSAIANRIAWKSQYRWENLAVADADGELEFAYQPGHLGGGHIRNEGDSSESLTIVKVRSVAIDNYLPADVTPDFVKIDVEGHELSVLKGMEQTIRRSPDIRLMLEYFTNSNEITQYGRDVIGFLRQLGLGICVVDGGKLRVVPEGEIPTGDLYLLATRTPESDSERSASTTTIKPSGLHYHAAYSEGEASLLKADGVLRYRHEEHSNVPESCLFYGPYLHMAAGDYKLTFDADAIGSADLAVTANFGGDVVLSKRVSRWTDSFAFSLREPVEAFEILLRKRGDLERLDLNSITIERLR